MQGHSHFVMIFFAGERGNAYLCRAIVHFRTLDCPKVDTCVNRWGSFSDGYVSGTIFVRKKCVFCNKSEFILVYNI